MKNSTSPFQTLINHSHSITILKHAGAWERWRLEITPVFAGCVTARVSTLGPKCSCTSQSQHSWGREEAAGAAKPAPWLGVLGLQRLFRGSRHAGSPLGLVLVAAQPISGIKLALWAGGAKALRWDRAVQSSDRPSAWGG